jgi:hypothetical protein
MGFPSPLFPAIEPIRRSTVQQSIFRPVSVSSTMSRDIPLPLPPFAPMMLVITGRGQDVASEVSGSLGQ